MSRSTSPRATVNVLRKRAQIYYTGRVQGVGFRYTVREVACGFDVAGFVRNVTDGRVELVAEGEETEITEFLAGIKSSQLGSHIRTVDVNWLLATGEFKGFEVTR